MCLFCHSVLYKVELSLKSFCFLFLINHTKQSFRYRLKSLLLQNSQSTCRHNAPRNVLLPVTGALPVLIISLAWKKVIYCFRAVYKLRLTYKS